MMESARFTKSVVSALNLKIFTIKSGFIGRIRWEMKNAPMSLGASRTVLKRSVC